MDDVCYVCSKPSEAQCSRCHAVSYCSPACQRSDWKRHKPLCAKGQPEATKTREAPSTSSSKAVASVASPAKSSTSVEAADAAAKKPMAVAAEPEVPQTSFSGTPGEVAPFDVVLTPDRSVANAQRVVEVLKERGVCVISAGADRTFQRALAMEAKLLYESGEFVQAMKGIPESPGSEKIKFDARDDKVVWFSKEFVEVNEKKIKALKVLEGQVSDFGCGLKPLLESQLGIQLEGRTTCMLSCYSGEDVSGPRYDYHVDNPYQTNMAVKDDGRRLTLVYYISDSPWDVQKDGGGFQVCLTNPRRCPRTTAEAMNSPKLTIAPNCDTLVAFFAHTMHHAVLPVTSKRRRFALSTWFKGS